MTTVELKKLLMESIGQFIKAHENDEINEEDKEWYAQELMAYISDIECIKGTMSNEEYFDFAIAEMQEIKI